MTRTYKYSSKQKKTNAKNAWTLLIWLILFFSLAVYREGLPTPPQHLLSPVVKAQEPKPTPTPTLNLTPKELVIVETINTFGPEHIEEIDNLISSESSYNPQAVNPNGGACGLFQSYPCEKMNCKLSDIKCQIKWGFDYISKRYGSPTEAWIFWKTNNYY